MKRMLLGCGCAASGCALLLLTACSGALPRTHTVTKSPWTNYAEVEASFRQVVPYQTTVDDLWVLGFHPEVSPNVKVLNYVDVIRIFMPNPAITMETLHPSVRACIEAKEAGQAYEIDLSDIRTRRYGNAFLDVLGFKRYTHETGWRFDGLILTTNGTVVYKISSGEPAISADSKRVKPLGPLQELDSAVLGAGQRAAGQ